MILRAFRAAKNAPPQITDDDLDALVDELVST